MGLLRQPVVMGSPPTVTVGTAGAGSTITSATRLLPTDASFRWLGAGYTAETYGGFANTYRMSSLTSDVNTSLVRCEIETNAAEIDFVISPTSGGTVGKFRFLVDGEYVTAAPQTGLSSGGAIYWVNVDFGSSEWRNIILEAVYCRFIGAYYNQTSYADRAPTTTAGDTVIAFGDSFTEGTGADWVWDGWVGWMGRAMGWDFRPSGVGSTGYLKTSGSRVKLRDRVQTDVIDQAPDKVIVAAGYNDISTYTAAQIGAEAALLFDDIVTGLPTAELTVVGLWSSTGVTTSATDGYTGIRDAIETEALAAGATFIDPIVYPAGTSWITGTGDTGTPAGDGNADTYIGSDGAHPTQAGHEYLGRRVAAEYSGHPFGTGTSSTLTRRVRGT